VGRNANNTAAGGDKIYSLSLSGLLQTITVERVPVGIVKFIQNYLLQDQS